MTMIIRFLLGFILVFLGPISCSDDGASVSHAQNFLLEESIDGMVLVNAKGMGTVVGTDEKQAKMTERPQMGVSFTYDFYMGSHEVICKDFNEVMKSETGVSVPCSQDSLPASNVTFYDAVLYANALSKKWGYDTIYSYASAEFDSEKHCIKMKNFKFDPVKKGFRLPTEAEWTYVASLSWNPQMGWNGENSESAVHKVCSFSELKQGFCDLAGNMLELVNDRYAIFADTSVTNFVGSLKGDDIGSCIVKGGSYLSTPSSMKLYNRGDTYPILNSTRGDYIGFRLAFGTIPDATWFSENGDAASLTINSLIEAPELRKITNSYTAKLAFRNDVTGNLVYVNYARIPKVVEIEDKIEVYHPDISPDGKRVAFCTTMEGSSRESSIYVRDLNETGSHLVKLSVESAAIPRWRVNPNGDTVIVYVSSAGNNKGDQFVKTSTWQVKFENGKFGTPQKLFDGAYHGGVSKDNSFAISSSPLLRAYLAANSKEPDAIWYNGEQACNASLSKDGTNRTVFLDFGGTLGRSFVGEKYRVHQRLLIADSTGRLLHSVAAPEGYSFDHTEWAVGTLKNAESHLITATLTDYNGGHRQIALVDLSNDEVIPLIESEELWHPCLWIWEEGSDAPKPLVDIDSAGAYYDSNVDSPVPFSLELGMRMQTFWKKSDKLQVAAFGSSTILNSIIEDSVKTFVTANMAVSMSDIHLHNYLIRNYAIPYAPNLKYVILELSPGFLFMPYERMTKLLLGTSPGIQYDKNHLSETTKNDVAELCQEQQFAKVLLAQQYIENTFLLPSAEWGPAVVNVDIATMPFDSPYLQDNLKIMKSLKEFADSNGVRLIAAIPPRSPAYSTSNAFDPYGPSWEVAHQIIDAVKDMGIEIFDEYKEGHHDYTDEMANNPNHVSYLGAEQFSKRLDAFLKTLK